MNLPECAVTVGLDLSGCFSAAIAWHQTYFLITNSVNEIALIEKTNALTAGNLIGNDHDEFISLLNKLDSASNADFPSLFQQLHEHTEQHFDQENQLMEQFAYPGEIEHKGEHQRVLGEFKQFKTRVDKGMITFGRSFVRERLPQWFGLHVATMDSALVAHINLQPQA